MKIRFRDIPNSPYGEAAIGTVEIPDEHSLDDYIGQKLDYEIIQTFSDLPYGEITNQGVLSKIGSNEFFDFKILKVIASNNSGSKGKLLLIGKFSNE